MLANLQERVIQTDQGMVVLSSQMSPGTSSNTDLSTLASVVTTLATMGKETEDNAQSAADALAQVDSAAADQVGHFHWCVCFKVYACDVDVHGDEEDFVLCVPLYVCTCVLMENTNTNKYMQTRIHTDICIFSL